MNPPRVLMRALPFLLLPLAAVAAAFGIQYFVHGNILASVGETGGDPLFYIGNAYTVNYHMRAGEISILQLFRKEILVDAIYWPFGRYITGVDADLPFLMLVAASSFAKPTAEGASIAYNFVVVLNGLLNCAAMYVVLRALKVRSTFLTVTAAAMWMAFPFYRAVVAMGHLGFLPFWPFLLAVAVAITSYSRGSFDIQRPLAVGGLLYLTALSSLQYAYFLVLVSIPVIAGMLLLERSGVIPSISIKEISRYLAVSGAAAVALMLLFPLHNNYVDFYSRMLSEIRVASRPIADLANFAVLPQRLLEKGGMWYIGTGFVVLLLCLLATFRPKEANDGLRSIPFLLFLLVAIGLLALAVSTTLEVFRSLLYAISPSARVYGRAVGLAIPLLLIVATLMLDRVWSEQRSRPLVIAVVLLVFLVDLNLFSKMPTTDLSKYFSLAHVNASRSVLGEQVVADFSPVRSVAYRAYAPFWDTGLTGQSTGIALDCADPLFISTFLYYGGTAIIDKAGSPTTCGNAPYWSSKIVAEQKFEDGSRIVRLEPGAVKSSPREVWREGMSPTVYSDQMWFPMMDLNQRVSVERADPSAVGGYRYTWKRGNIADSSYECKEAVNLNPLALAADNAGNVIGWFVGKPVYVALQPLACDGIRTPATPGTYSLDLEVDMPGIHSHLTFDVNVVRA